MRRAFFWLIIASFSVFFGEVTIGATLYPFFAFWGLLVILPLYGLHTLILGSVVYRFGKPRFETLYLAGVIFGLYEAYITKVVWNPGWESPIHVAGIGIFEVLVIVLFWHPFMSFILPIGVAELLTSKRKVLPSVLLKRPYLFAFVFGMLESSNSPSPFASFTSAVSTLGVILLLIYIWRQKFGRDDDMEGLLPTKRELKFLIPVLLLYYGALGFGINPAAIPEIGPQAIIWLLYALTFCLIYRALKRSKREDIERLECELDFYQLFVLSLIFTISAVLFSILEVQFHELKFIILVVLWLVGSGIGIISFWKSAKWALKV
ncbi:hypothetical protein [Thermococcus sp. MV5]|uniref:hypothetical protein n=1 Tax=Thermococcus sp. MV5 TaxID=1638272 RepID=UPI003211E92D